jgi:hypothetical protein
MNALVASVIRTLVPVIVGQVASWFLLLNVTLPASAQNGLSLFLGGALTAVYYVGVRVLEQQWPSFGILLGLTSSPDTYSKGNDTPAEAAKQTSLAATAVDVPAINTSALIDAAPATTFPKAAVDAAVAAEPAPTPAGFEAPIAPATTPTV